MTKQSRKVIELFSQRTANVTWEGMLLGVSVLLVGSSLACFQIQALDSLILQVEWDRMAILEAEFALKEEITEVERSMVAYGDSIQPTKCLFVVPALEFG